MNNVNSKFSNNFTKVLAVSASAGTGKTYSLAKRYVQIILWLAEERRHTFLEVILAITFTNKATVEMKERILLFLKKIVFMEFASKAEEEDILGSLMMNREKARSLARVVMNYIIENYDFFNVRTIDSFINSILSGCSFNIGFSPVVKVKDDSREYRKYALDRLLDKAMVDKKIEKLFEEFLDYYLFAENKEGWFKTEDIMGLLSSLYNVVNIYGLPLSIPEYDIKDLFKIKQDIFGMIRLIADKAPKGTHKRFLDSLHSFSLKDNALFQIEDLSVYFARESFPVNKGYSAGEDIDYLWKNIREKLGELSLIESRIVFSSYVKIFDLSREYFFQEARRDGVLFLEELNARSRELWRDETFTPGELYYRLAARLEHYLIDEFQDTSALQWANIFPIAHEAISSGGSLFYVGDKKQAIFRFRGGDASLFDDVKNTYADYNSACITLSKNYRSQKEIVMFNNEIFSRGNLIRFMDALNEDSDENVEMSAFDMENILSVFDGAEETWLADKTSGFVSAENIEISKEEDSETVINEKLLGLIREILARRSPRDIAILVRDNKEVKKITSWLIATNMPVESEKTLDIREHKLIKEIIALIKFFDFPLDEIAFSSFILGDIFSAEIGEALALEMHSFIFNVNLSSKDKTGRALYRKFANKFPLLWEKFFSVFFKGAGFIPLYEMTVTIFSKFNVFKNFLEQEGFFKKFLEFIKAREEDYSSVSEFFEIFDTADDKKDFYVNSSFSDSIRVVTIHKSKGLEFPVVIMPFFGAKLSIARKNGGAAFSVIKNENNALELVKLKKIYNAFSDELREEYKKEYCQTLVDELNVMYVALTRARDEMYMFIPSKISGSRNIAGMLFPCESFERGAKSASLVHGDITAKDIFTPAPSQYGDWIRALKEDSISFSRLANRKNIIKGDIYHTILSSIGNLAGKDKKYELEKAKQKFRLIFPTIKNFSFYFDVIEKLLNLTALKNIFYVEDGVVCQEKEIVDMEGRARRIDRLIITKDSAVIVDYKSSRENFDEYREQVLEYKKIIQGMFPLLRVSGFLLYLDTLTIEEVL
ncbi:UvrD/REP helicase [Candidatus Omnitrophus magneticus]|uniref:DNA 3'-5' helicase n=1 Tax=Candidatus Omnitrophus magneticus TaxID=1609969 RepID=A0A0F0CPT9_9BACT|nr:UvrD/REP helicase [Candidatus Omnitrophus magneticus]